MKIILFDGIDNVGIITEWKPHISNDPLRFDIDRPGKLRVGAKEYDVTDGRIYVQTFNLIMGEAHSVEFIDQKGNVFACGSISRTGSHTIKVSNPIEPSLVALCATVDKLTSKVTSLENEIKKIKNEYGVSLN